MTGKIKLALLIDAENMPPCSIAFFLDHCRSLGKPAITRCYGNAESLQGWAGAIAEHHLMPMMTPSGGKKDNATDFALTIDAVSMLHRDLFDCAVIASSDTDFTQLAMHIREYGKGIQGIGDARATKAMRKAFDRFVEIPSPGKAEVVSPVSQQSGTPTPAEPDDDDAMKKRITACIKRTFDKLEKDGVVLVPQFAKAFREDHPAIELGLGKAKKTLLKFHYDVDDKQQVTKPQPHQKQTTLQVVRA